MLTIWEYDQNISAQQQQAAAAAAHLADCKTHAHSMTTFQTILGE